MCREAPLEARAEEMRDPVTRKVEMALIKDSRHVTAMELPPHQDWRLTQAEGTAEATETHVNEQRERLRARRGKRIQQL